MFVTQSGPFSSLDSVVIEAGGAVPIMWDFAVVWAVGAVVVGISALVRVFRGRQEGAVARTVIVNALFLVMGILVLYCLSGWIMVHFQ